MSLSEDYRKLLETWRSNYGREHGWYVEYDGVCVAELVDCEFYEMFWDAYRIVPVANTLRVEEADLKAPEFWEEVDRFRYRNRFTGDVAEDAFAAADPLTETGQLVVRGLYVDVRSPNCVDRWINWALGGEKI